MRCLGTFADPTPIPLTTLAPTCSVLSHSRRVLGSWGLTKGCDPGQNCGTGQEQGTVVWPQKGVVQCKPL